MTKKPYRKNGKSNDTPSPDLMAEIAGQLVEDTLRVGALVLKRDFDFTSEQAVDWIIAAANEAGSVFEAKTAASHRLVEEVV